MTEIRFYHLQTQSLEQALPKLLLKAYEQKKNIIVKAANDQDVEKLNTHLWTFHPNHFLPHGSKKDGYADLQPIWLTSEDDNPNDAKILILTGNTTSEDLSQYDLVCEMLNGFDDEGVKAARQRWKEYKDTDYEITYWQQSDQGKWEQKA